MVSSRCGGLDLSLNSHAHDKLRYEVATHSGQQHGKAAMDCHVTLHLSVSIEGHWSFRHQDLCCCCCCCSAAALLAGYPSLPCTHTKFSCTSYPNRLQAQACVLENPAPVKGDQLAAAALSAHLTISAAPAL